MLVAFTPGGPSDVLARIIGKRLNEILHQPFIIENRPGAGGNIAAEQVARATPDGYTLLMGNNSILATNAALYKKLNYDAEKDFIPISLIGSQANILVVNPDRAGELHGGADRARQGEPGHDQLRLVRPRRRRAPVRRTVQVRGQDQHRARRLQGRGAGAAGRDRRPCADDVRHRRVGDRAHQATTRCARSPSPRRSAPPCCPICRPWTSSASRASTPPPGTAWLRRPARRRRSSTRCSFAVTTALKDPATQKALFDLGVDVVGNSPKEFEAYIKAEIPKWTAVVKASGANIE